MTLDLTFIDWRRELHQYPELFLQEEATTARIHAWSHAVDADILPFELKTGLVAETGQGEDVIALWADVDALPIEESTDVPLRPLTPGVMHVCGHDTHTSVMLGVALLLKQRETALPGRVRILFQSAEESFGGVKTLIHAGALQNVVVIFGMHNEPGLLVGKSAIRGGAFYANVDRFVLRINGKGTYAARPHEGKNATLLASQLVMVLQSATSCDVNTLDSVVLSVTRIQGGSTWNVLSESVELEETFRTHRNQVQQQVGARINDIAAGSAHALGVQIDVTWYVGLTVLVNDDCWVDTATAVAKQSGYTAHHADLHMGGEDFAVYLQNTPGAFVSIGSASKYGSHHPGFNPDERLIEPAAHYFTQLAKMVFAHLQVYLLGRGYYG